MEANINRARHARVYCADEQDAIAYLVRQGMSFNEARLALAAAKCLDDPPRVKLEGHPTISDGQDNFACSCIQVLS